MVRHIVLIKFQPQISEAEIAHMWRELHEIEGKVPGGLRYEQANRKA